MASIFARIDVRDAFHRQNDGRHALRPFEESLGAVQIHQYHPVEQTRRRSEHTCDAETLIQQLDRIPGLCRYIIFWTELFRGALSEDDASRALQFPLAG